MLPTQLATRWVGRAWRHLAACGSTNDEAARWADAGAPAGAVITTDTQSAGRGRLGRAWHSAMVNNLYYSVVLRPTWSLTNPPPLTLAVGVALCDAVRAFDARATLKWPNDVLLDGKKLAGILCEARTQAGKLAHVVVGIGCNLGEQEFAPELMGRATFLDAERGEFAATLCRTLEQRYEALVAGDAATIVDDWRARSQMWNQTVEVTIHGVKRRVIAHDLDSDGALLVKRDGAIERVISGEAI